MAPSLRFGSLVLLAVSWMLVAGCSGDDATGLGTGGSSGQAGSGGSHAGSGGTHAGSGSGGTHSGAAGTAGKGGSNATGGTSSGGTTAGGAAGEGGEPTSTAGSGGTGGTGGASGGTGGAAGTAGASGGTGGAVGGTGGASGGTGGATGGTGGATGGTGGATGGTGGASGGTGGASGGTGGAAAGTGGASGGTCGAAAGTGGATGGTGGATGGTGGATGGTGGASGGTGGASGGTGGTGNVLKNCAYQCATDDDCKNVGLVPQDHFCNPIRHRCEDNSVCATQSDCVGFTSGWYGKCTNDTGCILGDACVAFGTRGACAIVPDPDLGCYLVANPDAMPTQVARFGATGNVEVCAAPASDGICIDKACQYHCAGALGGCGVKGKVCNNDTGLCDCSASAQCSDSATTPVCGASSLCECTTNDQCASSMGLDKCYSGKCGCASAATCPPNFHNTSPICE